MIVPQMKGLEFEVTLWTRVVDLLKEGKKLMRFANEIVICDKDKMP
jgi:hypothetical protein